MFNLTSEIRRKDGCRVTITVNEDMRSFSIYTYDSSIFGDRPFTISVLDLPAPILLVPATTLLDPPIFSSKAIRLCATEQSAYVLDTSGYIWHTSLKKDNLKWNFVERAVADFYIDQDRVIIVYKYYLLMVWRLEYFLKFYATPARKGIRPMPLIEVKLESSCEGQLFEASNHKYKIIAVGSAPQSTAKNIFLQVVSSNDCTLPYFWIYHFDIEGKYIYFHRYQTACSSPVIEAVFFSPNRICFLTKNNFLLTFLIEGTIGNIIGSLRGLCDLSLPSIESGRYCLLKISEGHIGIISPKRWSIIKSENSEAYIIAHTLLDIEFLTPIGIKIENYRSSVSDYSSYNGAVFTREYTNHTLIVPLARKSETGEPYVSLLRLPYNEIAQRVSETHLRPSENLDQYHNFLQNFLNQFNMGCNIKKFYEQYNAHFERYDKLCWALRDEYGGHLYYFFSEYCMGCNTTSAYPLAHNIIRYFIEVIYSIHVYDRFVRPKLPCRFPVEYMRNFTAATKPKAIVTLKRSKENLAFYERKYFSYFGIHDLPPWSFTALINRELRKKPIGANTEPLIEASLSGQPTGSAQNRQARIKFSDVASLKTFPVKEFQPDDLFSNSPWPPIDAPKKSILKQPRSSNPANPKNP